ncbi:molybdopterin synthase catalytic subunit [Rubrivirga sp.]|uniref:molybdopterin synthase catalytic subunit n=1 Tax=Rubrivirga sp. TaxID=1885344 RepID=UPI003C713D69
MPSDDALWVEMSSENLNLEAAHAFLVHPNAGGTCVFVGRTRRWTAGDETSALRYEAYEPMAIAELTQLGRQAREQWELARVVVLHRLGIVEVSEASVVVGVASPHRAAAFEAARWLIDTLKESVPVWKTDL